MSSGIGGDNVTITFQVDCPCGAKEILFLNPLIPYAIAGSQIGVRDHIINEGWKFQFDPNRWICPECANITRINLGTTVIDGYTYELSGDTEQGIVSSSYCGVKTSFTIDEAEFYLDLSFTTPIGEALSRYNQALEWKRARLGDGICYCCNEKATLYNTSYWNNHTDRWDYENVCIFCAMEANQGCTISRFRVIDPTTDQIINAWKPL